MRRTVFLLGSIVIAGGLHATVIAAGPNIVFILADDYGIDGVGAYGSDRFKKLTPNIDSLAATGTRFDRAFAAPVCGPTRVLLMTGRYPFRTGGLSNNSAPEVSPNVEPSVAKILNEAGYATCHVGKWRQMGGTPGEWGFDEYVMSDSAQGPSRVSSYNVNGESKKEPDDAYYPDITHAYALDFIRKHRERPFFLYYASHLVHDPIVATPDSRPGQTNRKTLYNDNVAYLDKQVGELIDEIEKLGLRERTLIVFSSDNGTDAGNRSSTIGGRSLSGGKRDMLEGGANVPLIASWKGTVPAGRVVRDLVDFTDLLPTLADVADAKLPQGVTLDGRSFAPQLRGEAGTPREWIYVQYIPRVDEGKLPRGRWYAREDRWKLNESGELFDMKDAPFVETLVSADTANAAAVDARKRLAAVLAALNPAAGKAERSRAR
jgi:arylsulfatase A